MRSILAICVVVFALLHCACLGTGSARTETFVAPSPASAQPIAAIEAQPSPTATTTVIPQAAEPRGMGLGPALIQIQHVPVGIDADLGKLGAEFHLYNHTSKAQVFSVVARAPADAGQVTWELGYEALPDAAWFSVEPKVMALAAGEEGTVRLHAHLPERPELYNRDFMVCVQMTAGQSNYGAGLALAARVLVETERGQKSGAQDQGLVAVLPRYVDLGTLRAGASASETVVVRLNSASSATVAVQSLQTIEVDAKRHERFRSGGTIEVPVGTITIGAPGSMTPGAFAVVPIAASVPAGTRAGTYEQVFFVGDQTDLDRWRINREGDQKQLNMPQVTILRVRYRVE